MLEPGRTAAEAESQLTKVLERTRKYERDMSHARHVSEGDAAELRDVRKDYEGLMKAHNILESR